MPSKLHDEGLRITNKFRTKALVEYQTMCGGGGSSGANCLPPSSSDPTCPPVRQCAEIKGRKPPLNCPKKAKCYDEACSCKPHYAEYLPRYLHPSLRPFITSSQVEESAQLEKDESRPNPCPPEPPRKHGLDLEVELRGGKLLSVCDCMKRNGLQHDCNRKGCGLPECRLQPPQCIPSGGPGPYIPNLDDIFKKSSKPQQPAGDTTSPVNDTDVAVSATSPMCPNPNCPARKRRSSNTAAATLCSNPNCPANRKRSSQSTTSSICSNPDCPAKKRHSPHNIAASICSNPDCPAKQKRSSHSITESISKNQKCPAKQTAVVASPICSNPNCPARGGLLPSSSCPNCPQSPKVTKKQGRVGEYSCPDPSCPRKTRIPSSESEKELQLLKQFVTLCCNPECQARNKARDQGNVGEQNRNFSKSSRDRNTFNQIHKAEVPCPHCAV